MNTKLTLTIEQTVIEKAKKYDKDLREIANSMLETDKVNKFNNYIER